MKKYISTEKSVGTKQEDEENPPASYSMYRSCRECPLWVWMEVVCDDNDRALVLEGDPPPEAIAEVKMGLWEEFGILSGDGPSSAVSNSLRRIYLLRTQILGLSLCRALDDAEAIAYYRRVGITGPDARLRKKAESVIKAKSIRLREEVRRYESRKSRSGSAPTRQYYNDNLVTLSRWAGFRLTTDISLAEYAGYLKNYRSSIK